MKTKGVLSRTPFLFAAVGILVHPFSLRPPITDTYHRTNGGSRPRNSVSYTENLRLLFQFRTRKLKLFLKQCFHPREAK